ncbi:MAG: PQQ-like beta-propeller repeat protein [Verrucomicrobiota bacterium]|nr:PQQ-like beta-propeller repeat protein [Verrucomicrobiota bacterium]
MNDTEPPVSPRLASYLCPLLAIWLLWRHRLPWRGGKTVMLILFLLIQFILGILLMTKAGWTRVDWDGRGLPGDLRWVLAAPSDTDWKYSDRKPNPDDPAHWPGYRGARRDGVYTGPAIRTDWDTAPPKPAWTTQVGGGHASMTIARGRLFTLEQWAEGEVVTCYNLVDGRGLWRHAYVGKFNDKSAMGGVGPRSTPTWDDGRLYTIGAEGQLHSLAADTGKVIWKKNIFDAFGTRNLPFGTCASPWVAGEKLIITAGARAGSAKHTVFALDKMTGEVLWRSAAEKQAYMSPITATLAGREQILLCAGRAIQGLSLEDGKILWSIKWTVSYDNNIAQPVVIDDTHIFISAGYGTGCGLIEIKKAGNTFSAKLMWKNKNLKNKFTSSVLHKGHLYGLDDGDGDNAAYLVCINTQTGEEQWRGENYGHGQLLLAQGHLIIQCENGDLALTKATPESHQQIARLPALAGKTWNNPALANGRLYVRNDQQMICYDIQPGSKAGSVTLNTNTGEALSVLAAAFLLLNGLGCIGLGCFVRSASE